MELLPLGLLRQPYLKPGGLAPRPATPKAQIIIGHGIILGSRLLQVMNACDACACADLITAGSGVKRTRSIES